MLPRTAQVDTPNKRSEMCKLLVFSISLDRDSFQSKCRTRKIEKFRTLYAASSRCSRRSFSSKKKSEKAKGSHGAGVRRKRSNKSLSLVAAARRRREWIKRQRR